MAIPGRQIRNLAVRFQNPTRPLARARVVEYGDADVALAPGDLSRSLINSTVTATRILTIPSAADIIAASFRTFVGAGSDFFVRPNGGGVTVVGGTGITIVGNTNVPDGLTQHYLLRITNITAGSEAATVYDLGCCGVQFITRPTCSAVGTFVTTSVPSGGTVNLGLTSGSTVDASCLSVDTTNGTININESTEGDYVFTCYLALSRGANYTVTMGSSGAGVLTTQAADSVTAATVVVFIFQGHLTGAQAGDTLFVSVADDGAATEDVVVVAAPDEFAASSIRVDRI